MCFNDCNWFTALGSFVFMQRIKFNHDSVALVVNVGHSNFVSPLVVLKDESLLVFLDALPVSHKVDVEQFVLAKCSLID